MEWDEIYDDIRVFQGTPAYEAWLWFLCERTPHRHDDMMSQDMTNEKLREALGERRANLRAAGSMDELAKLADTFAKETDNG